MSTTQYGGETYTRIPRRGRLICLDGINGVGKSTIAQALADRRKADGIDVHLTRSPGGTEFCEKIRDVLAGDMSGVNIIAKRLLYTASQRDWWYSNVLTKLESGVDVVADRCHISNTAYGLYDNIGRGVLDTLAELSGGNDIVSDSIVILTIDVTEAYERLSQRASQTVGGYAGMTVEQMERLQSYYIALAEQYGLQMLNVTGKSTAEIVQILS